MTKKIFFTEKVLDILQQAQDTWTYRLSRPTGFSFQAGQFIRVVLYGKSGRKESRYFSLSSAPSDPYIEFTAHIRQSVFKKLLQGLRHGDIVEFYGPSGMFVLDDNVMGNIIMVAGGIGMAPYMSMIKYATEQKLPVRIWLLTFFREAGDVPVYFTHALREIQNEKRLHFINVLYLTSIKRPTFIEINDKLKGISDPIIYLCGSDEFVDKLEEGFLSSGVKEENIRKELFI